MIIPYHVLFPTKISPDQTHNFLKGGGKFTKNPFQCDILVHRNQLYTTLYQYYRENFHAILFFHPTRLLILGLFSTQYDYSIPYVYFSGGKCPPNMVIPYPTVIR